MIFEHRADTFVRDAEWTYEDGTLHMDKLFTFQEVRVIVEMRRQ